MKVAGLSDEAKQAARDTGLDDERSLLLAAAKAEDDVAFSAVRPFTTLAGFKTVRLARR